MRLPGSDKVIVGYDLGKDYAQISCYVTGRVQSRCFWSLKSSGPQRCGNALKQPQ